MKKSQQRHKARRQLKRARAERTLGTERAIVRLARRLVRLGLVEE